ncbi:MAG: corrinoid protein [Candidatus Bathyarchaeota archaeon]|nr:corrinoid protein [Candidatus Bathyarchaeota archaeon]
MSNIEEKLEKLSNLVVEGDTDGVKSIIKDLLESGSDPLKIVENGLTKGIRIVGERYGRGDLFLTELLLSAETMQDGMKILVPEIQKQKKELKRTGSMVIGTVAGDIHDLGKNIVIALFSANGFDVVDLGVDVPVQKFIDKVKELKPNILGLSALMTTTIPKQHEVINELKSLGLRDDIKVMIGGAATNKVFSNEIGADGYAENAIDAVSIAKQLIGAS